MKLHIKSALLLLAFLLSATLYAQNERNKITMTINHNGKNVTAELSAVNFGISRYDAYPATPAPADNKTTDKTANTTMAAGAGYYLSISIKKVSTDLLKVFAKKGLRFSGTIILTDTYGKNPPSELKFTNATVESYNDQFSSMAYDDSYSYSATTLKCEGLTVNGVVME